LWPDGEVVINESDLSIEHEVREGLIFFEGVEDALNGGNEAHAVLLKREIPLAVPVGVGNKGETPRHGFEITAPETPTSEPMFHTGIHAAHTSSTLGPRLGPGS
jgi:hypothetical protein